MLTRREFLGQATVALVLTPFVAACGSSDSSSGTTTSTNPTVPGCDGVGDTSTVVEGHAHTLCVRAADLATPPAAGLQLTTGTTAGHAHAVTLTAAQLGAIASGQSVTVTTGVTNSHAHGFTLRMAQPAAQPSQPQPGAGYGY